MRILVASQIDSRAPFGQHTRPYYLSRALSERGHDVWNVAPFTTSLDFGRHTSTGSSTARKVRAIRDIAQTWQPDVIYAHQSMMGALACHVTSRPVVCDLHSLPSVEWANHRAFARSARDAAQLRLMQLKAQLGEQLVYRRCAYFVAASDELREVVASRLRSPASIATVANGVSSKMLDEVGAGVDNPYRGDGSVNLVATIPDVSTRSNQHALDLLVAVASRLATTMPDLRVHILGCDRVSPLSNVVFHGIVPEVWPWLRHAEVCLLPYPTESALCGGARNKLLEALAIGRRTVTSQEGLRGMREARAWGAVFVPKDAIDSWVSTLAQALKEPPLTTSVRSEMYRYTWEQNASDLECVLAAAAA